MRHEHRVAGRARPAVLLAGTACALLAAGCAGPAGQEPEEPSPSPETSSSTASPSGTDGSASASASPTPTPRPPAEGVLRIGIPTDTPGLSEGEADAEVSGLDADAALAVASYLGFEEDQVQWRDLTSRSAAEELAAGRVDLVAGGIGADTPGVTVAGPYAALRHDLLVTARDPLGGPEDLTGRTVCVVEGSSAADALEPLLPADAEVLAQHGLGECATALETGRVDAVAGEEPALAVLARRAPAGTQWGLTGSPFGSTAYGIGLPEATSLCETVAGALEAREADGGAQRARDALAEASGIGEDAALREAGRPDPARCG